MAEQTGITNTEERSSHNGGGKGGSGKIAPFMKRNKLLVYGGGGLAVLVLMAHKGKGSPGGSQGTPQDQLQAASDYLAASNAAQNSALADPSLLPGGVAPVDTGGGSYTAQGPTATNAPGVTGPLTSPININVVGPGAKQGGTPPKKAPPKKKPKPHQPHKTKPHPANKKGKHPGSGKKTPAGHAKHSPVEVEAMVGAGAGVVVQGRHFPGAIGYRQGPPMRSPSGGASRVVTVDFGGHTERHMVHGNGDRWTDNVRGLTPPHERGTPQELPGRNNAVL